MNIPCGVIVMALVLLISSRPERLFAGQSSAVGISLQGDVMVTASSIVYHPNNIVSMWVKIVPEENSRTRNLIYMLLKEKRKDFRSYEYSSFLSEVDCERVMHREISVMHYNKNRNIIHAVNNTNALWEPINHQNGFHVLYMAFCFDGRGLVYGKPQNDGPAREKLMMPD